MKRHILILTTFFSLIVNLSIHSAFADGGKGIIVVTDMLPDDLDAIFPLRKYTRDQRIDRVLFITADNDVRTKAKALHNYSQALGFSQSVVVTGESRPGKIIPSYIRDYLKVKPKYLEGLAKTQIKSPWLENDIDTEISRILSESERLEIFLLANPASINPYLQQIPVERLERVVGMGFWKSNGVSGHISAYNSAVNPGASQKFFSWANINQVPVQMLPSDAFKDLETVVSLSNEARSKVMNEASRNATTSSLIEGLNNYRDQLINELLRNYGIDATFVFSWDPNTSAWLQDAVTVAAALNPQFVSWKKVSVKMYPKSLKPSELGFKVKVTENPTSNIEMATDINQQEIGLALEQAYTQAQLTPPFDVETLLEKSSDNPIYWIGKAAIDDMGLLRMLLLLNNRLELVVTDSSNTNVSANIIGNITHGYHRKDVKVLPGHGQTIEEMEKIRALGLERNLLLEKWGENLPQVIKPQPLKKFATDSIVNQLERSRKPVDIVVTASMLELYQVLSLRPDLISKIRSLHVMGGSRGYEGKMTRNWIIDPEVTKKTFDIINKYRIRTYIYSSHLLGGSLNTTEVPLAVKELTNLSENHHIEKVMDALRILWNQKVPVPGFDVEGNYGPSLAYMMGVFVALGDELIDDDYVFARRVALEFDGDQVRYTHSVPSSIIMVGDDAQSSMGILDQVASYFFRKADKHLRELASNSCGGSLDATLSSEK